MKLRKIGLLLLMVVLFAVFAVSAFQLIQYGLDAKQQESRYDELAAIVAQSREETTPTAAASEPSKASNDSEEPETEPTEPSILPEYAPLHQMNPHMVGWIQIEGTKLNYPVMQSPEEPDYYLYRNFDREYNAHGCVYVRSDCDVNVPSDNITIYGHNMKDGSMFACLSDYLDKTYWEENPYIRFDTLTEHHTYQIFAVFRTTATIGEGFEYHQFIDAGTGEDFDWFINQCKSLAEYDTGITPTYGDKVICLSTCEYTQPNGRLVVAAVRTEPCS